MVDGAPVEIQINVPEMMAAKDKAHVFYEEYEAIRRAAQYDGRPLSDGDRARLKELDQLQSDIYLPAFEAAMARINSSRGKYSASSSLKNTNETRSPSGQAIDTPLSSDPSLPSRNLTNTALGENSGNLTDSIDVTSTNTLVGNGADIPADLAPSTVESVRKDFDVKSTGFLFSAQHAMSEMEVAHQILRGHQVKRIPLAVGTDVSFRDSANRLADKSVAVETEAGRLARPLPVS